MRLLHTALAWRRQHCPDGGASSLPMPAWPQPRAPHSRSLPAAACRLQVLRASHNRLASLAGTAGLLQLRHLDVSHNAVGRLEELAGLQVWEWDRGAPESKRGIAGHRGAKGLARFMWLHAMGVGLEELAGLQVGRDATSRGAEVYMRSLWCWMPSGANGLAK